MIKIDIYTMMKEDIAWIVKNDGTEVYYSSNPKLEEYRQVSSEDILTLELQSSSKFKVYGKEMSIPPKNVEFQFKTNEDKLKFLNEFMKHKSKIFQGSYELQ